MSHPGPVSFSALGRVPKELVAELAASLSGIPAESAAKLGRGVLESIVTESASSQDFLEDVESDLVFDLLGAMLNASEMSDHSYRLDVLDWVSAACAAFGMRDAVEGAVEASLRHLESSLAGRGSGWPIYVVAHSQNGDVSRVEFGDDIEDLKVGGLRLMLQHDGQGDSVFLDVTVGLDRAVLSTLYGSEVWS